MLAKHVPENSIVRVSNGQIGRLANTNKRKPLVIFDSECRAGREITSTTEAEVIRYAAQLANDWLQANGQK